MDGTPGKHSDRMVEWIRRRWRGNVRFETDTLASLLPHIDLIPPKSVIGRNTVDAMDSGIIYGAASMLDGMIDRIQQELGQPVQAVATGGLSKKVTPYCRHSIIQDPNLLLKGLRILYYKNVK